MVLTCTVTHTGSSLWDHMMPTPPAAYFALLSCLAYSPILNMEARCFSVTTVHSKRTTQPYIPEGRIIHKCQSEKANSYTGYLARSNLRAGQAVAQWLRHYTRSMLVEGSRLDEVNESFQFT
jgi:hypothetical protein